MASPELWCLCSQILLVMPRVQLRRESIHPNSYRLDSNIKIQGLRFKRTRMTFWMTRAEQLRQVWEHPQLSMSQRTTAEPLTLSSQALSCQAHWGPSYKHHAPKAHKRPTLLTFIIQSMKIKQWFSPHIPTKFQTVLYGGGGGHTCPFIAYLLQRNKEIRVVFACFVTHKRAGIVRATQHLDGSKSAKVILYIKTIS